MRQSCHFERNFEVLDFVLLQPVAGRHFEHSVLTFITETFEVFTEKLCKVWFVRKSYWICSMKKWTLKFNLLYLLNHMCYFNIICRICGMNPQLITLKFGELLQFQRYWIFPRSLLFCRALCTYIIRSCYCPPSRLYLSDQFAFRPTWVHNVLQQ